MIEKLFKLAFLLYKRRLERKIDLDRWNPELSAKLDAIHGLLED